MTQPLKGEGVFGLTLFQSKGVFILNTQLLLYSVLIFIVRRTRGYAIDSLIRLK